MRGSRPRAVTDTRSALSDGLQPTLLVSVFIHNSNLHSHGCRYKNNRGF